MSTCAKRKSPPSVRSLVGWLRAINTHVRKKTHQDKNSRSHTSRREEQCPTAQPQCLVDRALHCSTELLLAALSPQLHKSQPLHFTVDLRPSPAVHPSLLTADQTPLHYTAALLYTAANIAEENPVAYTN